jgi:hypothetical protein
MGECRHPPGGAHPHAELRVLDRCGLLPHDERAEEFLHIATPFLADSPGDDESASAAKANLGGEA